MVNKYKNSKGVYIESHTDKSGKDLISIYNKNPSNPNHQSIYINYNTKTGKVILWKVMLRAEKQQPV